MATMEIQHQKLKSFLAQIASLEEPEKARQIDELKTNDPALYAQFQVLVEGAKRKDESERELLDSPGIRDAISSAAQTPRVQHLASTLGQVDGLQRASIIAGVAGASPALAEALRQAMFCFDDLQYAEPLGLQTLIARIDKKVLCAALRGASDDTKDRLFSQMSRRAAAQLREDIEYMGRIPRREVAKAQNHIESMARTLMKAGQLVIIKPGDEDGWVR